MTKLSNAWLPQELVAHVTAGCGAAGTEWLEEVPDIIARLEKVWSLSVGDPFPGLEYNFVAPATTADALPVVIKIAPPWDPVEIFGEAEYLRSRDGVGCVKLLAEEQSSRAILIERVVPGETLTKEFKDRELDSVRPAIDVLGAITRPCSGKETHIQLLDHWFDGMRRYGETEFPSSYAGKALRIYDELSKGSRSDLYLHGDYHPDNVVTVGDGGFIAIDPKGLRGNLGYEISVFLNNFHWWLEEKPDVRALLRPVIEQFAAAFDIESYDLRRWAYAQMVLGAWWNFVDMPTLYDGSVVKADIWDV